MKKVLRRRPSASMLVAMAALVVASSGTAIAASLVNGDGLIKKHSLSGNRLRNHTITGTQVNLNKLGKVPSAKNADHATSAATATSATSATAASVANLANFATNATNSTNATNAGTAANLTGLTRFNKSIAPAGTAPASAATTTLATDGPMTILGYCWTTGSNTTHAAVYLTSSTTVDWENEFNGGNVTAANTPVDVGASDASAATTSFDIEDASFGAVSVPSLSNYINGQISDGVNLTPANNCTFAGHTTAS